MKKFLIKISLFSSVLVIAIIVGFFLPPTPRASGSLLFAKLEKDELLKTIESDRMILVGGSGASFGFNSQVIKDSLNLNPINTGIHGKIGLIYMLDNTAKYVNPGDLIVVAAEYQHYHGDYAFGGEELLRTVLDIEYSELNTRQWMNILGFIPSYAISKLKPLEYYGFKSNNIYGVNSFNEYGDAIAHWGMDPRAIHEFGKIKEPLNEGVFKSLKEFEKVVESKGAKMYVTFPAYQSVSFDQGKDKIAAVQSKLKEYGFKLIGTPERYKIETSMLFDSPYHFTKEGATHRTLMFVEDFKKL